MTGCFVRRLLRERGPTLLHLQPQDDASESLGESRPNWTSKLLGLLEPRCGVPILRACKGDWQDPVFLARQ